MSEKDRSTRLVRSLRGGQMTIPAEFRRELGIDTNTVLQITLDKGELRVRPVQVPGTAQGSPWLMKLYEEFAPARQEAIDRGYTEHEMNDAIDAAVSAVRRER